MGLLSSITKPFKKVFKSDLGKLALGIAAYRYAPQMWGSQLGGQGGWGAGWEKFAPWLMGTEGGIEGASGNLPGKWRGTGGGKYVPGIGNLWQRSGIF